MTKLGVVSAALCAFFAGCYCVDVPEDVRARFNEYRAQGESWTRARDEYGFQPPVNMSAAIGWSILPGAGQYFMEHKMRVYGFDMEGEYAKASSELQANGFFMLLFSWIPYVYEFTLPCGLAAGTIIDVNRINNIAFVEFMDKRSGRHDISTK